MIRDLKALGLSLVAVLALTSVAASAAQAAEAHFTAQTGTTKITGLSAEFNQKFTTTAGSVECTGHFEAVNPPETSKELTVKAKYTPCRAFFGSTPIIEMNSCDYVFTAGTYGPTAGTSTGTAHITCGVAGDSIVVNAPGCVIKIGAQTGLTSIHYQTVTVNGISHVTVTPNVTNIKYSHSGFLCGTGSGTTGTYSGPVTIKGFNSKGAQTNISITST
jgi:hypothetical protein